MSTEIKKGVDYVGISVVYFCHDGTGRFVMAKRNNNTRDEHGRWDIGGGGIDFGDSVEGTVRKEVKEEYCADVLELEFLGFRDVHREHKGRATHWIALDYLVLVNSDQVKNGEPHKFDEVGWFTLDSIPANSHSQFPEFLRRYKERLKMVKSRVRQ